MDPGKMVPVPITLLCTSSNLTVPELLGSDEVNSTSLVLPTVPNVVKPVLVIKSFVHVLWLDVFDTLLLAHECSCCCSLCVGGTSDRY